MTKEEFERLERQAEDEQAEEACEQMQKEIHNEFVAIYNEIFDFCQECDLEPDPVIQIIVKKLSDMRRRQIKNDGYISKTYDIKK